MFSNLQNTENEYNGQNEFWIIPLKEFACYYKTIFLLENKDSIHYILWVEKADINVSFGIKEIFVQSDSILFIDSGLIQYIGNYNIKGKLIVFTNSFCKTKENIRNLKISNLFNRIQGFPSIVIDKDLLACFRLLENEYSNDKDKFHYPIILNLLSVFLLIANKAYYNYNKKYYYSIQLDYIIRFDDLLDTYFKKEKNVSFYARKIGITEKILTESVKKILNSTPKTIIKERVLMEAKRLLVFSNKNITETAFELGFKEVSYFIKYFTRNTGYSPSHFKEKFK